MSADWRSTGKLIGKWIFGILFVLAGVGHFVVPGFYMKIMPPYLPLHRELVLPVASPRSCWACSS